MMKTSKQKRRAASAQRYAAKLLFQFRIAKNGHSSKRRLCEERIIVFEASSDRQAVAAASKRGAVAQYDYLNITNDRVYFEFVGIRDMIHLGAECESDEVWYDIHERIEPMERRRAFIPPAHRLFDVRGFEHRRGEFVQAIAPAAPEVQEKPNSRFQRTRRKNARR